MRRSARNSLKFGVPVVALGLAGLMLIPAQPGRIGSATIASGAAAKAAPVTRIASASKASISAPTPVAAQLQAELQTRETASPAGTAVSPAVELVSTPASTAPDVTTVPRASPAADADANSGTSAVNTADTSNLPAGQIGPRAVNARSGPAAGNGKLFVLAAGENVKVGETSGGWVHVYRQDGTDGWIYGRYLAGSAGSAPSGRVASASTPQRITAQPSRLPPPPTSVARVTNVVPLLQRPDDFRSTLGILQPGERVRVLSSDGRWLHVVTEDGASGWIPA